jgi:hypothetical protein
MGARGGGLFFPGVLIPFVRLEGGAYQDVGGHGVVSIRLEALPSGMALLP